MQTHHMSLQEIDSIKNASAYFTLIISFILYLSTYIRISYYLKSDVYHNSLGSLYAHLPVIFCFIIILSIIVLMFFLFLIYRQSNIITPLKINSQLFRKEMPILHIVLKLIIEVLWVLEQVG